MTPKTKTICVFNLLIIFREFPGVDVSRYNFERVAYDVVVDLSIFKIVYIAP